MFPTKNGISVPLVMGNNIHPKNGLSNPNTTKIVDFCEIFRFPLRSRSFFRVIGPRRPDERGYDDPFAPAAAAAAPAAAAAGTAAVRTAAFFFRSRRFPAAGSRLFGVMRIHGAETTEEPAGRRAVPDDMRARADFPASPRSVCRRIRKGRRHPHRRSRWRARG